MDLLSGMKQFVAIVQAGSFARAAKDLYVSPSKLSKQLAWLEGQLNTKLFIRTTRQLEITEAGKLFYEKALVALEKAQEAKDITFELEAKPHGLIRIGTSQSLGQRHLTEIVIDFLKKYPEIKIELMGSSRYMDLVEDQCDIVFQITEPDNRFENCVIANDKFTVLGSPRYFKKHGKPKTPEDLIDHNCLVYDIGGYSNQWIFRDNQKILASGNFLSNNILSLIPAAVDGIGLIYFPSLSLSLEIKEGRLIKVLEEYSERKVKVYATYRRQATRKVDIFLKFIKARFSEIIK